MKISSLKNLYLGHDVYIIGSGPTLNAIPVEFFKDKICISLNSSYKLSKNFGPFGFFHHIQYSSDGVNPFSPNHDNFDSIKYPVIKGRGREITAKIDYDNPLYYFFDYSLDIKKVFLSDKNTNTLYYNKEGCSLHGALQLAWIIGAKNIFLVGCDSKTFSGKHYATYDKNKFRDNDELDKNNRKIRRNYDSYIYGSLLMRKFLEIKGINLFNLSPLIGYHLLDFQLNILSDDINVENFIEKLFDSDDEL